MRLTPVLAVSMLLLTGLCRADAATDACDAAQKLVDNRSSLADYDRAMELYQKAIDLGDKRGQAETGIGWIYSWRKHDQAEALRWWTKGCELGDAGGCANAFTALTDDNKHPAAGMALLERGREAGCLWATKELRAACLRTGPRPMPWSGSWAGPSMPTTCIGSSGCWAR